MNPFEPLTTFYQRQGLPLPTMGALRPEDMPQPYHQLLVHEDAMTPTLEGFFGQRLVLRVLEGSITPTSVRRQVVLAGARDEQPVELGAIRIDLTCFEEKPREVLRQGRMPMGTLLSEFKIPFVCRPALFFRAEADATMRQALGLGAGAHSLYGRCNQMLTPEGRLMADVVEILAPIREAQRAPTLRAV